MARFILNYKYADADYKAVEGCGFLSGSALHSGFRTLGAPHAVFNRGLRRS